MTNPDLQIPLQGLTLLQPWQWCFLHPTKRKRVENRTWYPKPQYLQRYIALHMGKGYDKAGADAIERITGERPPEKIKAEVGEIFAVAKLIGVITDGTSKLPTGYPRLLSSYELALRESRYFFGPYGWVFADFHAIEPVPCRGALQLWTVPDDVKEQVIINYRAVMEFS